MRKLLTLTIVLSIALGYGFAFADNEAPKGAHYNLNIIGVPKGKNASMTDNNGHRIFVSLSGNTKILLREGDDFSVLDANGTDNDGAAFQLPNPDSDNNGMTAYSVYARALGKPGGTSTTTTCFTDGIEDYCSIYQMVLVRNIGKQTFQNVSRELLYIYVDTDDDGKAERYPLFDDSFDYFWNYTNDGLKLLQLRFYAIESPVPEPPEAN